MRGEAPPIPAARRSFEALASSRGETRGEPFFERGETRGDAPLAGRGDAPRDAAREGGPEFEGRGESLSKSPPWLRAPLTCVCGCVCCC
jgi:hypothetical protein